MVSLAMSLAGELDGRPVHVRWIARGTVASLMADGLDVVGVIRAPGFAAERRLNGNLTCRGRTLRHRWEFVGDDAETYSLAGEQLLSMRGMPAAYSLVVMDLAATFQSHSGDATIGTATLRFDARNELGRLLRSIRLW